MSTRGAQHLGGRTKEQGGWEGNQTRTVPAFLGTLPKVCLIPQICQTNTQANQHPACCHSSTSLSLFSLPSQSCPPCLNHALPFRQRCVDVSSPQMTKAVVTRHMAQLDRIVRCCYQCAGLTQSQSSTWNSPTGWFLAHTCNRKVVPLWGH